MSDTEKILYDFDSKLREKITEFFDSQVMFGGQYVLNSTITKDSSFEKSPLCSNFGFYNISDIPVTEIILGNLDEVVIEGEVKVATFNRPTKRGKELNNWSTTIFGITVQAKVTFNAGDKLIEIDEITVRDR